MPFACIQFTVIVAASFITQQSEARRYDDVPNEGVVHSHSLSAQNETSAHAGSLLKATMDDTHISEEGDKTRAWMVSVLQPLAESPSVPPGVSFSSTLQEHDTTHQHKFVDGYLQGAGTQVEMNRTRDATSSAVPHISGTQMSSFLVPSQSADLHLMQGPAVGREPAPFLATFSEQTESSTSHDPTWRPLTGRKLDVRPQYIFPLHMQQRTGVLAWCVKWPCVHN